MTNQEKENVVRERVLENGGVFISGEYKTSTSVFVVRCSCGKELSVSYHTLIYKNRWCRDCSVKNAIDEKLNKAKNAISQRGGFYLGHVIESGYLNLLIRCSCGHEWKTLFHNLCNNNQWCIKCGKKRSGLKKRTIDDAKNTAVEMGGMCLSDEYVNAKTKMSWVCEFGHEWEANYDPVSRGHWCPECRSIKVGNSRRFDISVAQKLANDNGGTLLSSKYINNSTSMMWKCKCGYVWNATFQNIRSGTWCPRCIDINNSQGEKTSRSVLENYFNKSFPKQRMKWLRFEGSRCLELDGYNEELGIAFEYNGRQHYQFCSIFHKDQKEFVKRLKYDKAKRDICRKMGVFLIEIPYTIKKHKLESFVLHRISRYKERLGHGIH